MSSPALRPETASAPTDHGQYVEFERFIDRRIQQTRGQVKFVDLASGLLVWLSASVLFLLGAALVDAWIWPGGLPGWGRFGLWTLALAGSLWYLGTRVAPLVLRRINPLYAAAAIERGKPTLKNSVVNFLLLRDAQGQVPSAVFEGVEQQAAAGLAHAPAEESVDRSILVRLGYVLLGIVLLACLYTVASPKDPLRTVARVFLPWADIPPPARVTLLSVLPGDAEAFHGQQLEVTVEAEGAAAEALMVYTTADGTRVDHPIPLHRAEGDYRYKGKLPETESGLQQDLLYHVQVGDARSPRYRVKVLATPTITVESVEYQYPAYTGLATQRVEKQGDIEALEGTKVVIRAIANGDIKTAHIDLGSDNRFDQPLTFDGREAELILPLAIPPEHGPRPFFTNYELRFTNTAGHATRQPIRHSLAVTPDLPPEVRFLQPLGAEVEVPENAAVILETSAIDPDFALRRVVLKGTKNEQPLFEQKLLDEVRSGQFGNKFTFVPARYKLAAGEEVLLQARAEDNRLPKPGVGRSTELLIHVVAADPRAKPEPREGEAGGTPPPEEQQGQPQRNRDPQRGQGADNDDRQQQHEEQRGDQPRDRRPRQPPGERGDQPEQREPKQADENQGDQKDQGQQQDQQSGEGGQQGGAGSQSGGQQAGSGSKQEQGAESGQGDDRQQSEGGESGAGSSSEAGGEGSKSGGEGSDAQQGGEQGAGTEGGENRGQGQQGGQQGGSQGKSGDAAGDGSGKSGSASSEDPVTNDGDAYEKILDHLKQNDGKQGEGQQGDSQPQDGKQSHGQKQADGQQGGQQNQGGEQGDEQGNAGQGKQGQQPGERARNSANDQQGKDGQQGGAGEAGQQRNQPGQGNQKPTGGEKQAGGEQPDDGQGDGKGEDQAGKNAGAKGSGRNQRQQSGEGKQGGGAKQDDGAGEQGQAGADQGGNEQAGKDQSGKQAGQQPRERASDDTAKGGAGAGDAGKESDKGGAAENDQGKQSQGAGQSSQQPGGKQGSKGQQGKSGEQSGAGEDPSGKSQPGERGQSGKGSSPGGKNSPDTTPEQNGADPQAGGKGEPKRPGQANERPQNDQDPESTGQAGDTQNDPATGENGQPGAGRPDQGQGGSPQAQGQNQPKQKDQRGKPDSKKRNEGDSPRGASDSNKQSDTQGDGDTGQQSGGGKTGGGQSADNQGKGSAGENTPDDEGAGRSQEQGPGETGEGPGQQGEASKPTGESSKTGQRGAGSKSASGNRGHQPGESPPDQQKPGGPAGDGKTQPGQGRPGQPNSGTQGEPTGQPPGSPPAGPRDAGQEPGGDEANLEYADKATDLVLDRLRNDLNKGKADPELLRKLGWSKSDLAKFVRRWEEMKRSARAPEAPAPKARRELDAALRSLGLTPAGAKVGSSAAGDVERGLRESRSSQPPAEFQDAFRAYSRGLSGGKSE